MKLNLRCLAVLVLAGAAALPVRAADFTTLSYPLAINVEGEQVRSSVYLKLRIKTYDLPLDVFSEGDLDARETRFAQWMGVLRNQDYAKASAIVRTPPAAGSEPTRVHQVDRTPKQIVDMYHDAFGGLRDVTVVAQVMVGSKSLFVWEARTGEASRLRRGFTVEPAGQKLVVSEVSMEMPVELLIVDDVMNMLAQNPERYRGSPNLETRYEYALPVGGAGSPGASPVLLQFDGEPVEIALFGDAAPAPGAPAEIAALYRETYRALRDHDLGRFLQHFTEKSQAKWRKWYASMAPSTADQFLAAMTRDRSLKFILDAGPFYIVFHGAPRKWTAGSLKYDYVVKTSKPGELRFANVSAHGFFDDVIGNPALFDQNVLRRPAEAESRVR